MELSERAINTVMRKADIQELKKGAAKCNTRLCNWQGCVCIDRYGKPFCYALLPTVFDELRESIRTSIMLCISPLTAFNDGTEK